MQADIKEGLGHGGICRLAGSRKLPKSATPQELHAVEAQRGEAAAALLCSLHKYRPKPVAMLAEVSPLGLQKFRVDILLISVLNFECVI